MNPNRVDLPVGDTLKGEELARFKSVMGATKQEFASLLKGVKVASFGGAASDTLQ